MSASVPIPVRVEYLDKPRDRYVVEIKLYNGERHGGIAATPSRALTLAAVHWVGYYEPDLKASIDMVEEITERADAQGSGLVAYPVEDIKTLLKLIRGEPTRVPPGS